MYLFSAFLVGIAVTLASRLDMVWRQHTPPWLGIEQAGESVEAGERDEPR
jgi:hypothetical protein